MGDSQKEALKDCLQKIKDVPISLIMPPESDKEPQTESDVAGKSFRKDKNLPGFGKLSRLFLKGAEKAMKDKPE